MEIANCTSTESLLPATALAGHEARSPAASLRGHLSYARGVAMHAARSAGGWAGASLKYNRPVSGQRLPGGVVHKLPADLREALIANPPALDAWKDITPLARNEFICWVEDAKQRTTRERRIRRTGEELEEGQRRPCCWPGCKHRERTGK
jgi:hypothetical protein